MNMKKLTLMSAVVFSAAFSFAAHAQTTTVVIDDDYVANGTATAGVSFFGSSGSNAIETNTDSFGLVSGTSGRTMHGLFETQTLASIGDQVIVSATFITPATVGATNEEFRIGLFDHLGRTGSEELGQNTSFSSSSPEPLYNDLPGFYATIDIEAADPATDLDLRRNEIEGAITVPPTQTGTFLASSSNFDSIGSSSGDAGYAIVANTSYTITFTVERIADNDADTFDNIEITTQLFQGTTLLAEITREDGGSELSIGSFDIGMFAAQAGSNAAGSSSSASAGGEAAADNDNGIDFTSFNVSFFDADGVSEPEPPVADEEACFVVPNQTGGASTVCL